MTRVLFSGVLLLFINITAATSPSALQPKAITPLPLGTIVPTGWYRDLLNQQLHSLSGNLSRFWPDVRYAPWFGGNGTSQGNRMHERGPYWLNGALPLAYLLTTNQTAIHRRAFGPAGPSPRARPRRALRGHDDNVHGHAHAHHAHALGGVPFDNVHPPCGDGNAAGCPPANISYPPWSSCWACWESLRFTDILPRAWICRRKAMSPGWPTPGKGWRPWPEDSVAMAQARV